MFKDTMVLGSLLDFGLQFRFYDCFIIIAISGPFYKDGKMWKDAQLVVSRVILFL